MNIDLNHATLIAHKASGELCRNMAKNSWSEQDIPGYDEGDLQQYFAQHMLQWLVSDSIDVSVEWKEHAINETISNLTAKMDLLGNKYHFDTGSAKMGSYQMHQAQEIQFSLHPDSIIGNAKSVIDQMNQLQSNVVNTEPTLKQKFKR